MSDPENNGYLGTVLFTIYSLPADKNTRLY